VSRWKPVSRPGGIYCSPACGCKCTREQYDRAHEQGQDLAASLGAEWTYRVWENGGWHYAAKSPCKRINLHAGAKRDDEGNRTKEHRYTAFLGEYDDVGGRWAVTRDDPKEAVRAVVTMAREALDRTAAVFTDLSNFESEKEK